MSWFAGGEGAGTRWRIGRGADSERRGVYTASDMAARAPGRSHGGGGGHLRAKKSLRVRGWWNCMGERGADGSGGQRLASASEKLEV